MTVVNLDIRQLTQLGPEVATATVVIEFLAGSSSPAILEGAQVTFAPRIEMVVTGAVEIDVPPTGMHMAAHWWVVADGGARVERYVTIPEAGPIDFGLLLDVDPATFAPSPLAPTIAETAAALIATQISDPSTPVGAELSATFVQAFADTAITYDGAGNVATVTEAGVLTSYTYNSDGTVATDTRLGVTREYTYDGAGNLVSIEEAA